MSSFEVYLFLFFFFFNDTATTEIYTLSLHDALPILVLLKVSSRISTPLGFPEKMSSTSPCKTSLTASRRSPAMLLLLSRSEEHTSELQSRQYLVCRLLLEKKKKKQYNMLM